MMYDFQRVILTFFILLGMCIEYGYSPDSRSFSGSIELDESQIEEIIEAYFLSRCETYKSNLSTINFASVNDARDSRTSEWLKLEQEIREIQNLIQNIYPVTILDCRNILDFDNIEYVDDNEAKVILSEDFVLIYEHRLTKPSVVANIQHEIWLKRTIESWVIIEDLYTNDFTRMLNTLSKTIIFDNIRKNRDLYNEDVSSWNQEIGIHYPTNIENGMQLYNYNRADAVKYADIYYDTDKTDGPVPSKILGLDGWDSSWNTIYKEYESDCTNFISQAVFEGVSYTASDPNYFYPDPIHYEEWWYYKFSYEENGSTPWIRVGDFYEFLTENYFNYENFGIDYVIRGPAGTGVSPCNIQLGDVVFMYENDGDTGWVHTVIVDGLDSSHCNGNNVYVAAHSDDAQSRPLSDYSGYLWYPVEIKGYFNYEKIAFLPMILQELIGITETNINNPYPAPQDISQPPTVSEHPYPEP